MTASEMHDWNQQLELDEPIQSISATLDEIETSFAAVERERNTSARVIKATWEALGVMGPPYEQTLHEAVASRVSALTAEVARLRKVMGKCEAEGQCYCDGCERIRAMHSALAAEEEKR